MEKENKIKTPVWYDDVRLAIIDADGDELCYLDNWLDEIDMDGERRGDIVADILNQRFDKSAREARLVEALEKIRDYYRLQKLECNYCGEASSFAANTLAEYRGEKANTEEKHDDD